MNTSMFKFVIILSLVFFPLMAQSAIIDVPDDFETIQAAIDASENGDEIHVSPGEYVENIDFDGKIISVIGNPDNPEEVIIDGGGDGNVVMIANGETDDTILSGFTIRNGDTEDGGGIYCVDSYPTLLNLIVRDNVVTRNGGGIYCTGSDGNSIRMERLEVTSNQSWQGAGIFLVELDVSLSNSIISENYSTGQGSGIYCGPNTISNFDNLTITGNESRSIAAGISYISPIEASLTNSIFSGNQSEYDGAGFSLHSPDNQDGVLTVSNCIFTENEGRSTLSATFGTLQMDHVLLHHTPYQYQPIFLGEGERIFTNLTLSNNVGRWTIKQVAGSTIIRNTISYYNEMWEEMLVEGGDFEITYSDIEDGFEGEGNIDADPLFVDAENGDFHLTEDSPCIDVGNPDSDPDPDGTRADMGAFYFPQEPQVIIVPDDYETIQAAIDAAEDGDEIRVSAGEYVENIDFTGKDISLIGNPDN
ncbi:MAG: hypothetical protein HN356_15495, partial [Calditrichaeota bacterium]|nr:hypothetical protein [Calditrichota bacterium]